jgi:hypothetical protein
MENTILAWSLRYARRGLHVFPLKHREKVPAFSGGFYGATTNAATITRWFGGGYSYNVGVRTGPASGVLVFDVDGPIGMESLAALEAEYGELPATRMSTTGKGKHLWFRSRLPIPSSIGKIAPGIDIKCEGGYVVAPPSIHPAGAIYTWANNLPAAALNRASFSLHQLVAAGKLNGHLRRNG